MVDDALIMNSVIKNCKEIKECNTILKGDDVVYNYMHDIIHSDVTKSEDQK